MYTLHESRIIPRCIGLERLVTFFDGDRETARAVRKAMREGFERRRGFHVSHDVGDYLEAVHKATGGPRSGLFGVESLWPDYPDIWYLNAGDAYTTTLIYNSECHAWAIGCWGDKVK